MSIARMIMRNAGLSEAEILERLGPEKSGTGLTPEQVEAANLKTSLYLKQCQDAKPMTVADLPRKPIEAAKAEIKADYEAQKYDMAASRRVLSSIVAVAYSDAELCEKLAYDPAKGLLISGGIGIGKTTAFLMCKKHEALYASIVSCLELKKAVAKGGYAEVEKYERIKNVVFDDLGREGATANSYGNKIEAVADIIAARYENWIAGKVNKTYFTTNLSLDQLADLYSHHIVDRVKQMCNFLILPQEQKSFR